MSWSIAGDWLAVAGLILLTLGTGVQALANLAEFKSLRQKVTEEVEVGRPHFLVDLPPNLVTIPLFLTNLILSLLVTPRILADIRARGGDEAVELAKFKRLTLAWTIIMIGSAFALAAGIIQLLVAYR